MFFASAREEDNFRQIFTELLIRLNSPEVECSASSKHIPAQSKWWKTAAIVLLALDVEKDAFPLFCKINLREKAKPVVEFAQLPAPGWCTAGKSLIKFVRFNYDFS